MPSTTEVNKRCNWKWTGSPQPVITSVSQSAPKRTEVMFQPAPSNPYQDPIITVKGQKLQAVENVTYLCITLSHNIISNASSAFGRLRKTVWERRGIHLATKLKAVVLTTLLCCCETWTAYRRHEKQLNHFHLRCLWTLLNIRWQDKISKTEVLQKAKMPSIITFMRKVQIRWAGYVTRMPDVRIAKQLLYGELFQGKRFVSGQRKRFEDCLKVSLIDFSIDS